MATVTVFTNAGKGILTAFMVATSPSGPFAKYVGLGTGTATALVTDTALGTELTTGNWAAYARASATVSQQTTSVTNDTMQWSSSWTSPGTVDPLAITELANFDASTSGNIGVKSTFSAINMSNGDTVVFKLQLQFT